MRKFLPCASIFLFFFFLPVGWSKHWLIPQSLAGGVLVDYLMPDLWIQDIIALILISANFQFFPRHPPDGGSGSRRGGTIFNFQLLKKIALPAALLLFTVSFSSIPLVSLVYFLRLVLVLLTGYSLWNLFKDEERGLEFKRWALAGLAAALFWTGVLAIGQLAKQGTVFGWWFFGEPVFGLGSGGVKKIVFFGKTLVAPMTTFPHSNIMGAFGLLTLVIFLKNRKLIVGKDGRINIWLWRTALFFSLILSVLSFSIPIWFLTIYLIVCQLKLTIGTNNFGRFLKNNRGKRILLSFFLISLVIFCLLIGFLNSPSISRRLFLAKVAWQMFLDQPFFGVGWGCFTKALPEYWQQLRTNIRFLQPVHNLFLLMISEIGLIGVGGLVVLTKRLFGRINFAKYRLPITVFLVLSFFDHYFWTTTQGIYLLVPLFTLAKQNPRPD